MVDCVWGREPLMLRSQGSGRSSVCGGQIVRLTADFLLHREPCPHPPPCSRVNWTYWLGVSSIQGGSFCSQTLSRVLSTPSNMGLERKIRGSLKGLLSIQVLGSLSSFEGCLLCSVSSPLWRQIKKTRTSDKLRLHLRITKRWSQQCDWAEGWECGQESWCGCPGGETREAGCTPNSPRSLMAPRTWSVGMRHTFIAAVAGQEIRPDKANTPEALSYVTATVDRTGSDPPSGWISRSSPLLTSSVCSGLQVSRAVLKPSLGVPAFPVGPEDAHDVLRAL